ncbi:MAG: hypothetical protein ACMUHM_07920 [Thermoplasmatota archaeon]
MRARYTPLLFCLLLIAPAASFAVQSTSIAKASPDLYLLSSPTRGKVEWTPLVNGSWSSYVNASTDIRIEFDNMNGTLEGSDPYDPYYDHNATVRAAIDAAPQWLNDTLSWKFSEFWSYHGQRLAELLLNDSVDWRYRDEIAFTIAHLPTNVLSSMWVWPELLIENVEMVYKVAEEVKYASITDVNTSEGLRTTITYNIPGGTVTLPDEIYYENLVMPRNSMEQPNYMNRSTKRYTYPDDGWFWRTFLYYESDPGYPVLRDTLLNQTTLWNGTTNDFQSNGAVGAVTKWQMDSMIFGMPEYRSNQPVMAYGEHIGMCGENSYLLSAVAKTALIPTVTVINFDWMHGWNMFYDRGWHVWRAYDGIINDTYAEGGPGGVNAHAAFNPDSTQFNSAYLHTQTANLTVGVFDANGIPVDGAMVKLYSYPASNYEYDYGLIGNHTDANGETDFEIGFGYPYYVQVITPMGLHLDDMVPIPMAVPSAIAGVHHWFNVTLNKTMPLKANLTKMDQTDIGLQFNATVDFLEQSTRSITDPLSFSRYTWKSYPDRSVVRLFFLDDENYQLYLNGSEFFPAGVLNISAGAPGSIVLPDGDWHIVLPGLANPLTRSLVGLDIEVSRSKVTPEAVILSPDPGTYMLGTELHFSGILDPYPPYLGEVQYFWFVNTSSDPISSEREFSWTPEVGIYLVTFSVWKDTEMIGSARVVFEIEAPNRPPIAVISAPEEDFVVTAGTNITFLSTGSMDPDGDPLEYEWTIPATGTFLSDAPSFTRKFVIGDHTVRLKVTDPQGLASFDWVNFSVQKANSPPIPYIDSPENYATFYVDEYVLLSAFGSYDLDGDELAYTWTSDLDGLLSSMMEDNVLLTLGQHVITLNVSDGKDFTLTEVIIYIDERPPPGNEPPVAVISSPDNGEGFYVRQLIIFHSNGSLDPEGANLTFRWSIDGINLSNERSFALYLAEGVHTVTLFVSDGELTSKTSITVIVTNRAPVISITMNTTAVPEGEMITIIENETQIFDASGSFDPDGGGLSFNWTLDGEELSTDPVLTVTMARGYHEIRLLVYDEEGRSALFVKGLNCIYVEPPEIPDGGVQGDNKKVSLAWYLVPLGLILLFIIISVLFFLLTRSQSDFYVEE